MKTIIITGGAGFIGSNLIRHALSLNKYKVINVDKLTYAGNIESLDDIKNNPNYSFIQGDICDEALFNKLFSEYKPCGILNLAAETHVDRSIDNPDYFINTNIMGTYALLKQALNYYKTLSNETKKEFRFLHISTDEVFGSLDENGLFTEQTAYDPRSPYSASKASSDHLVRAYYHTFCLPTLITNCSNNYGPFQFPEKLIPLVIMNALEEKPLPVYGEGATVRDWLFVGDHCRAIMTVFESGKIGETYNIGGANEKKNIDVVNKICEILDNLKPRQNNQSYKDLITFVKDRPGHDLRYAIDASKIKNELKWTPLENFESGIAKTVEWYINNKSWCDQVSQKGYNRERLGLALH